MSKTTTDSTTQSTSNPGAQAAGAQAAKAKSPWELPFAVPFGIPMPDVFAQMARDQIARTQAVMNELAVYEGIAVQRARTAVDELARLTSDSIGYVGQLAIEWRKLSIETMQRTADAFAPKA